MKVKKIKKQGFNFVANFKKKTKNKDFVFANFKS